MVYFIQMGRETKENCEMTDSERDEDRKATSEQLTQNYDMLNRIADESKVRAFKEAHDQTYEKTYVDKWQKLFREARQQGASLVDATTTAAEAAKGYALGLEEKSKE